MSYTRAVVRVALGLACWLVLNAVCAHAQGAAPATSLAIAPTHTIGIDPIIGRFVDRALARGAAARGYDVLDAESVARALTEFGAAQPAGPGDLARVAERLGAACAASATASTSAGSYDVLVQVVCAHGAGPYYAKGAAGQLDLENVAARLLASALPPAAESAAAPPVAPAPSVPAAPGVLPAAEAEPEVASPPRVRIALHDDLDFGLADDSFFANVAGARVDLRIGDATWLGVHVGYANLPARSGRANNVLPYAQFEQRIALAEGSSFAIPLRLALGYLPRNGGFLRASSGIAIPLGERAELVLDLLAPAFFQTPDKTLLALTVGTEVAFRL